MALGPRSSRPAVFVCRCAVHPSEKLLIVNSSIKKPPLLSALPADGAKAPVAFASRVCDAQAPGAATEQESCPAPSPPTRDGLLRTPGRVSRSRLAGRRPWQPSTHTGARSSKLIADPENSKPEVARARAAPPSGVPAALGQPGGGTRHGGLVQLQPKQICHSGRASRLPGQHLCRTNEASVGTKGALRTHSALAASHAVRARTFVCQSGGHPPPRLPWPVTQRGQALRPAALTHASSCRLPRPRTVLGAAFNPLHNAVMRALSPPWSRASRDGTGTVTQLWRLRDACAGLAASPTPASLLRPAVSGLLTQKT